jgi:hypothetical protein
MAEQFEYRDFRVKTLGKWIRPAGRRAESSAFAAKYREQAGKSLRNATVHWERRANSLRSAVPKVGRRLALLAGMAARKTLDQRPGPVPEIRVEDDSVVFQLDMRTVRHGVQLLIRCDSDGNVLASIVRAD